MNGLECSIRLTKVEAFLAKRPERVTNLGEAKAALAEVRQQINLHHENKETVHEGEFCLGKLPLEIQDIVSFYNKQNNYREIGKKLKLKFEQLSNTVENQEALEAKLLAKEKELLQINERIGQLQQQILEDNDEQSDARESQAAFLRQDISFGTLERFKQT